jgi:hypothetical protein
MANRLSGERRRDGDLPDLRIGQVNVGSMSTGGAEIEMLGQRLGYDIVCVQEPEVAYGKLTGLSRTSRLVMGSGTSPTVAVVVLNPLIDFLVVGQVTETWAVTIAVKYRGFDFHLSSVYCKPSGDLGAQLARLSLTHGQMWEGNRGMVCGDFNARSPTWCDRLLNDRGTAMEDWVARNSLAVLNVDDETPTFETANEKSFIDLTLVTPRLQPNCGSWKVLVGEITTDGHRLLSITIRVGTRSTNVDRRFDVKRANWHPYRKIIQGDLRLTSVQSLQVQSSNANVEQAAYELNNEES